MTTRWWLAAAVALVCLLVPVGGEAGAPGHATPQAPPAPGGAARPSAPGAPSMPAAPGAPDQPSQPDQPGAPDQPSQPGAPTSATPTAPPAPGMPAAPGAPPRPESVARPGAGSKPSVVRALEMARIAAREGVRGREQVVGNKGPVPAGLESFGHGDLALGQAPMAGKLAADLQSLGHMPLRTAAGGMVIASCGHPGRSQVVQVTTDGRYLAGRVPAQAARPPAAPYVKCAVLEAGRMRTCRGALSPLPGLPWRVAGPSWAWAVEAPRPEGVGLDRVLGVELGAATGVETELAASALRPGAGKEAK